MSKTRTGFRRAHCLAPVVGGGGYLLTGLGSVNRPFRAFATIPRNPRIWPQKPSRAAEGLPSKSVTIRLRLGNILISNRISSAFRSLPSLRCEPRPSGRRLSSGRLPGCQPILFQDPRDDPRIAPDLQTRTPLRGVEGEPSVPSAARLPTSRSGSDF